MDKPLICQHFGRKTCPEYPAGFAGYITLAIQIKTPKDLKLEELLQTIIKQNESILATLERIAEKLDVLDDITCSMSSVEDELQWHKDLSATAQIIKAVESVADAVREQS